MIAAIFVTALATYGLSALVANYDGPMSILARLRSKAAVAQCAVCLSVWVAIPLAYITGAGVIGYLAALGMIIVLERT